MKKFYKTVLIIIILLSSVLGFSQTSEMVSGQVRDSISNEPISQATVILDGIRKDKKITYYCITDEYGFYLFSGVEPGSYMISAEAEGYYPSNIITIEILFNQTINIDFLLLKIAPILISATPGHREITLEWEHIQYPYSNNFIGGDPNYPLWTIYIGEAKIDGVDMEAGDEIRIVDGNILVGVFTLDQVCTPSNQFGNDLIAFSVFENGVQGYTPGNNFTFVAWDESSNRETTYFEYNFSDPYGDAWTGDVFPIGEGQYSMAELSFCSIPTYSNIYYEDGTLIAEFVWSTSFTDNNVIPGQEYCYYIKQRFPNGQLSLPSNILCATPLSSILGELTGIVSDILFNPIKDALITIDGTTYNTTSGEDGTYLIEDIEPGNYTATASSQGYEPVIHNFTAIAGETSIVDFSLNAFQSHNLVVGYQFVSTRIIPENPDLLSVLEGNLNENLDFVRNSSGQTLRKIGPNWVNGIGDWITTEGYIFRMNAGDQLNFHGGLVACNEPIYLYSGYQFVSYLPCFSMDALEAFSSIVNENLDFIRNSQGQILRKIGPNWINGIGDCNSGEGYLVKMLAADVLIYPSSSLFTCGDPFTDPRNEQIYLSVQIGDQCWMAENLNIGYLIPGNQDMTDNGVIEKYCYAYDNSACDEKGGLYQWDEMMQYKTIQGEQGICPDGWYIPSDEDWKILEGTVDSQYPVGDPVWDIEGWRGFDVGLNLKFISDWFSFGNGTNDFGFSALPGGYRMNDGNYSGYSTSAYFWSSTEKGNDYAWSRALFYSNNDVNRNDYEDIFFYSNDNENPSDYDGLGFSVRCIKNETTVLSGFMTSNLNDNSSGKGYIVEMPTDDVLIYPSSSTFNCGTPFTDPRNEQIYLSVQIGDQCWMAENLNIGDLIPGNQDMSDNGVIEKYCFANDNRACDEKGGLYQWDEMMQYTTIQGEQGICPDGWYIPSDEDWKILEGTVDSQYPVGDPVWDIEGWRGFDVGLNLKFISDWFSFGNGTNDFGFSALPGGYRMNDGNYSGYSTSAYFWSSTEKGNDYAWSRALFYSNNDVNRNDYEDIFFYSNDNKNPQDYNGLGFSVRCIRDESSASLRSMTSNLNDKNSNKLKHLEKQILKTDYFTFNGGNPAESVYTLYIEGLEIGDEIAAFDGDILVGAMKINSQEAFDNDLPVFSTLNSGKGYTPGNPIICKVWNKKENQEYNLTNFTFSNPYGDAWTENVFPSADGEYSLLNFSKSGISDENMRNDISIYPNPTTGIITIGNLARTGKVWSIEITDITGKIVFNSDISDNSSSIKIDLSQLEKGVYFLNLNGKDFNQVNKIVIQ